MTVLPPCPRVDCKAAPNIAAHHWHDEKDRDGTQVTGATHTTEYRLCQDCAEDIRCYSAHVPKVKPVGITAESVRVTEVNPPVVRTGDTVSITRQFVVEDVSPGWIYDEAGDGFCIDPDEPSGYTLIIVSRSEDPDAELINAIILGQGISRAEAVAHVAALRSFGVALSMVNQDSEEKE